MSKYDSLKKKKADAFAGAKSEIGNLGVLARESRRVADVAHNAGEIITDLDRQFAAATHLGKKDVAFLFLATALQCTKWMLMPELGFGRGAGGGTGTAEAPLRQCPEPQADTGEFYTWQQILLSPAPYLCDVSGASEAETPLNRLLNRKSEPDGSPVWGDDPLFGWVFGTLNILSRTVTLRDARTFKVSACCGTPNLPPFLLGKDELEMVSDPPVPIPRMLDECYRAFADDPRRLLAAVAKQAIRVFADAPEKFGVSVPRLCDRTPDEVADDIRNAAKWRRETGGDDQYRAEGAAGIFEQTRMEAGTALDAIDKAQSYLDGVDGLDGAKEVLDKARAMISEAQDCMDKPAEIFASYASVPEECLGKVQDVIESSRGRIGEARDCIRQACGIAGVASADDGMLGKLLDNADGFLGNSADIAYSIQDLLTNPQALLEKVGSLSGREPIAFPEGKASGTAAMDLSVLGLQAGISILINALIQDIHCMCYNEAEDGSLDMYAVKTRKILSYSNAMASGSNVLYAALSKDVAKLDIGGIAVTVYRVVSDRRFIQSMKQEFLSKRWHDAVMGDGGLYGFLADE